MVDHDWGSPDEPMVHLDDLNAIPRNLNGDSPHEDSWRPINLAILEDQPPVQPTLGAVGLVYPGKRHVFSGPQESAKTLAAYAILLEVVRDEKVPPPYPTEAERAPNRGGADATLPCGIIIDFEMGRWDARDRLRELGATDAELHRILYIEPSDPATHERISSLVALAPALVIVDAAAGAYDLQGLDDNKRQDVERFTRLYVRQFWKADIATIVLDHVVKDTETRGKYAIGSERKIGGADVHLGFTVITPVSRGHSGLYKITTHKDRGGFLKRGSLADMSIDSDPTTHTITWQFKPAEHTEDTEIWMPTALMTKVSVYLSLLNEPVSRKRILDDVVGRLEHKRRAIDHLVRLEYATETPGERQAKLIQHVRLFHENDVKTTDPDDIVPHSPDMVPDQVSETLVPDVVPSPFRGRVGTMSRPAPDQLKTSDIVPQPTSWADELPPPDETTYDAAREEPE